MIEDAAVVDRLSDVVFTPPPMTGLLVAIDGSDGSGKTTLIEGIVERLNERNIQFVRTRQPTTEARELDAFKTYLFEPELRDLVDYRALLCMMIGDRLQHIHQVILPALREGHVVLCDRYIYTQMVTTRTRGFQDEPWMYELYRHVVAPHVSIITDGDLDTVLDRISARSDARESFHEREHVHRNLEAYRNIAALFNLTLIDTVAKGREESVASAMSTIDRALLELQAKTQTLLAGTA